MNFAEYKVMEATKNRIDKVHVHLLPRPENTEDTYTDNGED